MDSRARVIIDTDPGIDDVLAMLLAFSASPEELEIPLVSITFGNIDVQNCLRNVVSLFHSISQEQSWRVKQGKPPGFDTLKACKPVVAVGAEEPLADQLIMADFFHGKDGLGGIHHTHPHLSPSDAWKNLFDVPVDGLEPSTATSLATGHHDLFTPSHEPAHREILRVLRDSPPDTVTILAVGPLTNLAMAAAEDTATFLRVKEVAVMGGAINLPGNITPLAEFNTHADPVAFARVLALTSPTPASTMPPALPTGPDQESDSSDVHLGPYQDELPSRLNLTLFPLDITTTHVLMPATFESYVQPLLAAESPIAIWIKAFMGHAFQKSMEHGAEGFSLHDPLTVWYALKGVKSDPAWHVEKDQDVRVETAGQWTRGACIVDRRGRTKKAEQVAGDHGGWQSLHTGNRVGICDSTPGQALFEKEILDRIFGFFS